MSYSERKKPIFGRPYTQHYNDQGKKVGKTFEEQGVFGPTGRSIHTTQDNEKIGSTKRIEDAFTGKNFQQHYDKDGKPSSYTVTEETIWGKLRRVTKPGRKLTTQEILGRILALALFVYGVVTFVLPVVFALLATGFFIYALWEKKTENTTRQFKWPAIISLVYSFDYIVGVYSAYLVEQESFMASWLYPVLGLNYAIAIVSAFFLFEDRWSDFLLNQNIQEPTAIYLTKGFAFVLLFMPFFLVENRHGLQTSSDKIQIPPVEIAFSNEDSILKFIENNENVELDGDFATFLEHFAGQSDFQYQRTRFPFKVRWLIAGEGGRDSTFYQDSTQFFPLDLVPRQYYNIDYSTELSDGGQKALVKIWGKENGINLEYYFEKENGKWFLIELYNASV
jgi:hypothetical protein